MNDRQLMKKQGSFSSLRRIKMKCLCIQDEMYLEGANRHTGFPQTNECSASVFSSQNSQGEQSFDISNIEEAESSLRGGVCLNYEEARALLGRLEYQRGNVEAALRVFDGLDLSSLVPKIRIAIAKRSERQKIRFRRKFHRDLPPMSIHAVSLLMEAIFLKSRALQDLGRFKEASECCNIILDTVESALPVAGSNNNVLLDGKLQQIVIKAVELLPELWKLAGFPLEAILSYRRALLGHWNLDAITMAKIQKEFAIFLLYGGCNVCPPNLSLQLGNSFLPKNNFEEAILLLMLLLRKVTLKKIDWDPSLLDHLTFALSMSGQLSALGNQVEGLLPGVIERKDLYYTLALCYSGGDDSLTALNLLRKLLSSREDPNSVKGLLLASKICAENKALAEEGVSYARRLLNNLDGCCDQIGSVANCLLGISLSAQARSSVSESERISRQAEALAVLDKAEKMNSGKDPRTIFNLSLEYAEQRKLDAAYHYAKQLLKIEAGSNLNGWILLARILSAQKQYVDAESIVDAALEQTGSWNQEELLSTKARLQIAQGHIKNAIETYTRILAIIQLKTKTFSYGLNSLKGGKADRRLELQLWHDLANVYISMSQWTDAETCLSKIQAISPTPLVWHGKGKLYEAKGLLKEALGAYAKALDLEPAHIPSLVSSAMILKRIGEQPLAVARSFLTDALRLDRSNHITWFNLGLVYNTEGGQLALEAAECFQAAAFLEETAPVEPFR